MQQIQALATEELLEEYIRNKCASRSRIMLLQGFRGLQMTRLTLTQTPMASVAARLAGTKQRPIMGILGSGILLLHIQQHQVL